MRYYFILFLIIISFANVNGQQWSEPINISNQGGSSTVQPKLCIDKSGRLHCVWTHNIGNSKWRIYYACSSDDGDTWSNPTDISTSEIKFDADPSIVADSNNNIHVIFLYNCADPSWQQVCYRKFDGTSWSDPVFISEGYTGCSSPKLAIDNNNRIYCFWGYPIVRYTVFYRYLENGIWSPIFNTYNFQDQAIFLYSVCSDSNNNLHCTGRYYNFLPPHENLIIYFSYERSTNQWSQIDFLSNDVDGVTGNDITVDTNQFIHVSWGQRESNGGSPLDSTIYRFKNSSGYWSDPEVLFPGGGEQQIIIDKYNNPNIVQTVTSDTGANLLHFYHFSGQWIGNIITALNCNSAFPNLATFNDYLYLVYVQCINGEVDILFSKSDVITYINRTHDVPVTFSIFPNPVKSEINITFSIRYEEHIKLSVFSMNGDQLEVLTDQEYKPGTFSILWNLNQLRGQHDTILPGQYLIRFQTKSSIITKKIVCF